MRLDLTVFQKGHTSVRSTGITSTSGLFAHTIATYIKIVYFQRGLLYISDKMKKTVTMGKLMQ